MEEKKEKKSNIYYSERVDVVFQTYRKSLLNSISKVSEALLISSGSDSPQYDEVMNLLNLLYNQYKAVDNFCKDYCKIKEVI